MTDMNDKYVVTIDGDEHELVLTDVGTGYIVQYDSDSHHVVVDRLSSSKFLYKIDSASSEVDITGNGDKLEIFLEGKLMNVRVEPKELAELRKKAGAAVNGPENKVISAPMPGLVLSTEVKAGETVEKNKALVIIEAMKMENMIRAPFDGMVKEVFVSSGQAVEKGDKLLELE
jgi:biotin carboxyl carrier protein